MTAHPAGQRLSVNWGLATATWGETAGLLGGVRTRAAHCRAAPHNHKSGEKAKGKVHTACSGLLSR